MKRLKFVVANAVMAATLIFSGAPAQAQIPVTDVTQISTHVANQAATIAKWVMQFNQMKTQIETAQSQLNAMMGSRGMGSLMDGVAAKSTLPTDWKSVLSNIKSSPTFTAERGKLPTLAGMPNTNALYDVIASQNAVMSDLYTQANARLAQVQSLMGQIDSANDPAAKQDLMNRLVSEQNAIQANQNLVGILQQKQKLDLDAASQAAQKEYLCKEFKKTGC